MLLLASKTKVASPEVSGIKECFTVGEVIRAIPRESIDKALCSIDRRNRREGRFPDHLVVYFVIFMALFMELSYIHVFEKVKDGLAWLYGSFFQLQSVTDAAIVQARQRLGSEPFRALFKIIAKPLATVATPGAFFRDWRLVIIDGTIFDVEDTPANGKTFGRQTNHRGDGAFPQVRCVALIEYATRAVIDLVFGPYTGSSELSLSKQILEGLKPGMLCLADRLYPSFAACQLVISNGSQFVWRASKTIKLKPEKKFSDGSYLAKLYDYGEGGHYPKGHMVVRVIEYQLANNAERYRLITSILDPIQASANELARLYPKRWSQETFNGEIKTVLRQPRIVLRSKSPDLVLQELYGLFLAHFVVRFFMFQAASKENIPPEVLSFKHSVFVIKNHLPLLGNFSP